MRTFSARGDAGREGDFEPIRDLADALGGEVAASCDAVDEGWSEPGRQVGQTGKTVRPDLYLACGISGVLQHLEGMEESEVVVINTDPNAPTFDNADYGIVGDLFEGCPELAETVRLPLRQRRVGVLRHRPRREVHLCEIPRAVAPLFRTGSPDSGVSISSCTR